MRFLLFVFLLPTISFAQLSIRDRVAQAADEYKENLEKYTLYGDIFRAPITKDAKLACARVAQIILKQAVIPQFQKPVYLVRDIQFFTKNWQTVAKDSIEPGDVVFWKRRFSDDECKGGGDCHVGIAVNHWQTLDNKGIAKRPFVSPIKWRLGWKFLYAKRPPDHL